MTTIKAIRLASLVTAINVLVASGFSIVKRCCSSLQIRDIDMRGICRFLDGELLLEDKLFPYAGRIIMIYEVRHHGAEF